MPIRLYEQSYICRWKTNAKISEFPGSALRGSFGKCLKRDSCLFAGQECQTCIERKQCAYNWIFETECYDDKRRVNSRPHPYVVKFTDDIKKSGSGDSWRFSLLLFDKAIDLLPVIDSTVETMGRMGIGGGLDRGCGRFQIIGSETISPGENGTLVLGTPEPSTSTRQVRISLQTPLRRLKGRNTFQRLDFQSFIRLTLRRVAALETAYGSGEPNLDYSGLVKRAGRIKTIHSTIHWKDRKRYSNRQQAFVPMSGFVGEATFKGELDEFVPLLRYAEQVHLGKQTVYGLGRLKCEYSMNDGA